MGAELAAELVHEVGAMAAGVVIALPDGVVADPLFAAARAAARA